MSQPPGPPWEHRRDRPHYVEYVTVTTSPLDSWSAAERELAGEIVDAGYKALAMKRHPDQGGSTDAMQQLVAVVEKLRELLT